MLAESHGGRLPSSQFSSLAASIAWIPSVKIRPARNILQLVRSKFYDSIHKLIIHQPNALCLAGGYPFFRQTLVPLKNLPKQPIYLYIDVGPFKPSSYQRNAKAMHVLWIRQGGRK